MKAAVCVLLLALLSLGEALKCYSCPDGSTSNCGKVQQCSSSENSCLKVKTENTGMTYRKCVAFADCDFEKVKQEYGQNFQSQCCSTDLCNSAHNTPARPLIGLLGGLAALCWALL